MQTQDFQHINSVLCPDEHLGGNDYSGFTAASPGALMQVAASSTPYYPAPYPYSSYPRYPVYYSNPFLYRYIHPLTAFY